MTKYTGGYIYRQLQQLSVEMNGIEEGLAILLEGSVAYNVLKTQYNELDNEFKRLMNIEYELVPKACELF